MPARNYQYGALRPAENIEIVESQMRLCSIYRNALIARERARRECVSQALTAHYPEIAELEAALDEDNAELDAIHAEIAARNAAARRKSGTPKDRAAVTAIKNRRREHAQQLRDAKQSAFGTPEDVVAARKVVRDLKELHKCRDAKLATIEGGAAALEELSRALEAWYAENAFARALRDIDAEDAEERKRLRAESGLHWGSYLAIEDDLSGIRAGAPPEFVVWDGRSFEEEIVIPGEGRIAAQCQGGVSWADALAGENSRIRIEIVDRRKSGEYANFYIRVGSDGRSPVWAVVPIKIHRHPPADARIKWVYLHRERVGLREVWTATFSLEAASWEKPDQATEGTVAIEVGWRRLRVSEQMEYIDPATGRRLVTPRIGEGLRVAVWLGDDGRTGELVMPESVLESVQFARQVGGICKLRFNAVRDELVTMVESLNRPEWMEELGVSALKLWKSQLRLAALYRVWESRRFLGDEEAFERLQRWYKNPGGRPGNSWRGRYQEAADINEWLQSWRTDFYRNFVASLRRRYRKVVVEAINWHEIERRPEPQEDNDDATRRWKRVAAVGRLVQLCNEGFAVCVKVDAAETTVTCHRCGKAMPHPGSSQYIYCEECGEEWDVDENSVRNLLKGQSQPAASGD